MATIATVTSQFELSSSDPVVPRFAAFPVSPSAAGFCLDVEDAVEFPIVKVTFPFVISGALSPESNYLESTIGQIWPR